MSPELKASCQVKPPSPLTGEGRGEGDQDRSQPIMHPLPSVPSDPAEPFGSELTAEGLVAGRQGRGNLGFCEAVKLKYC